MYTEQSCANKCLREAEDRGCCWFIIVTILLAGGVMTVGGFYTWSIQDGHNETIMSIRNQTRIGDYLNGRLCYTAFCYDNDLCTLIVSRIPKTVSDKHSVWHKNNYQYCSLNKESSQDAYLNTGIVGCVILFIGIVTSIITALGGCKHRF